MKAFLYFFVMLLCLNVFAEEYHVDKSAKNEVKFISDAPIEDFEGITDKIDGYLYYEQGDLTKNSQLYFEVELNSLDTGIGLRNRHMKDNYLQTDKYPITYYKGKIIKSEKLSENEFKVTSDGTIFIHGVEKPLTVVASLTRQDKQYHVKCNFEVKLSDFNIKIPSLMFYKINETMKLSLDFYLLLFEKK